MMLRPFSVIRKTGKAIEVNQAKNLRVRKCNQKIFAGKFS